MKNTILYKVCVSCKKERNLDEYWYNGRNKNGSRRKHSCCKYCQKEQLRKRYTTVKMRLMQIKYKKAIRASRALKSRILAGKIIKPSKCLFCDAKKVQGHHLIYDFPYIVVWVCSKHHKQIHEDKSYE